MTNEAMKTISKYPSEREKFSDLADYLTVIKGLRPRWRALKLPTQTDRIRPYGEDRALWFRGQADATWGLTPKIWREQYSDANEAEMCLEFESVGHPLTPSGNSYDKWHWYFLMQHYGAPTRLLDFTIRDNGNEDAVVWAVDPWRWNRAHVKDLYGPVIPGWAETAPYLLDLEDAFNTDKDENQTNRKWPIAIEPSHIDRRIAAQGSKFMLFGTTKDMTISPAINNRSGGSHKHAILDKILIPSSISKSLKKELHLIGINERSLFPDLEGLGKHIAWEWQIPEVPKGKEKATIRRIRFQRNPKPPRQTT